MSATTYTNFYENLKEATMRLVSTIVLYDGKPYYVLTICDHNPDGIFRVYMDDMSRPDGLAIWRFPGIPYEWYDEGDDTRGKRMDEFLSNYPDGGIIRKMMNSPKFDRFRPFPLGMCNVNDTVVYMERAPCRQTQQGLTNAMINYTSVTLAKSLSSTIARSRDVRFGGYEMYRTIVGDYPSPFECLQNLNDPSVVNAGAGFHRNFALVKGPVGLLFLVYKQNIVGYMPNGDFSRLTLNSEFRHTKEVIEGLNLFEDIRC